MRLTHAGHVIFMVPMSCCIADLQISGNATPVEPISWARAGRTGARLVASMVVLAASGSSDGRMPSRRLQG